MVTLLTPISKLNLALVPEPPVTILAKIGGAASYSPGVKIETALIAPILPNWNFVLTLVTLRIAGEE